jgi:hypothetical protein
MQSARFKTNWVGAFLFIIPLAALALLATDLTLPVDHVAFLKIALARSIGLFLVIWILSTFQARLSAAYFLVGFFFLVLWGFAGIPATAFINQWFDASEHEVHVVKVLRKYTTDSPTGPIQKPSGLVAAHYAVVSSWKGSGEETISVRPRTYSRIEAGSPLELTVRRGGLNLEWIEAIRVPGV